MKSMKDIAAFVAGHGDNRDVAIAGRWHNLQLKPDLGSGELLNVGVAFVDQGNRVHLRMARDLSRLRCLYDDRVDVRSFEELCCVIEDAYNGTPWDDFQLSRLTSHASLGGGRYASGTSIGQILTSFYEATVPLGRAQAERSPAAHRGRARNIPTDVARDIVISRLIQRMGQRVVPYIARGPWVVRDESGREHRVEVPIRASGRLCASVISLWTKDPYRRKFQLAKAGLDLDTVQANAPGERLGLFVMRPMAEEGYSKSELDEIDDEIDEAAWQLRKLANIEVEQGEHADELAGKLETWLEAA